MNQMMGVLKKIFEIILIFWNENNNTDENNTNIFEYPLIIYKKNNWIKIWLWMVKLKKIN